MATLKMAVYTAYDPYFTLKKRHQLWGLGSQWRARITDGGRRGREMRARGRLKPVSTLRNESFCLPRVRVTFASPSCTSERQGRWDLARLPAAAFTPGTPLLWRIDASALCCGWWRHAPAVLVFPASNLVITCAHEGTQQNFFRLHGKFIF